MKTPYRVVVLGGGVYGACSAYELAKAGVSVTLIERDPTGAHASGKNPGNLNPILAAPPKLWSFAMTSFQLHQQLQHELVNELGCRDYQVEKVRRIMVCFNEKDRLEMAPIKTLFDDRSGFSASWLGKADIMAIEPRLSHAIESGLLLEGNLSLDAYAFNHAILEGVEKRGGRVVHETIRRISRLPEGYLVDFDHRCIECDALVLASGPWVADLKIWLGLELPVVPVKGEMLRMRLAGNNISHDFTYGMISLYRRGDGEVWVGVTREHSGFDEMPSELGMKNLLDGAARILPAIVEAKILEHLASLRPMAPGGLPLIGAAPGLENVFIANGGGIKGMLTCTGVGRAIRDLVIKGTSDLPIQDFGVPLGAH